MPACSFCKKNYEIPRGLTVFKNDGTSLHFCSSKCKRNLALKRDPKKVNWVRRPVKSKEESKKGIQIVKKEEKVVEEKISRSDKKAEKLKITEKPIEEKPKEDKKSEKIIKNAEKLDKKQ